MDKELKEIISSVNVMWQLFCQTVQIGQLEATNLVEKFLEAKDIVHESCSKIVQIEENREKNTN